MHRYVIHAIAALVACQSAAAEPQLEWKLKNNFPFFKSAEALSRYTKATATPLENYRANIAANPAIMESLIGEVRWKNGSYDHRRIFHSTEEDIELRLPDTGKPCSVIAEIPGSSRTWSTTCDGKTQVIALPVDVETPISIRQTDVTLVQEVIRVREKVLIGLGDSYASGEGNPDIPARHHADAPHDEGDDGSKRARPGALRFGWVRGYRASQQADWLDHQCHRSLYSHQVQAAAAYAIRHPQELVRFGFWSCAGAEIVDGLLVAQRNPPGGDADRVAQSQIDAAVTSLCKVPPARQPLNLAGITLFRPFDPHDGSSITIARCEGGTLKKPDVVMLTIGGNDIDFSSVVLWALSPSGGSSLWKDFRKKNLHPKSPREAAVPISSGHLVARYRLLQTVLDESLGLSSHHGSSVLPLVYPDPLIDGSRPCVTSSSMGAQSLAETFYANRYSAWNITSTDSRQIAQHLTAPLQSAVLATARLRNWRPVHGHLDDFKQHGFCAHDPAVTLNGQYTFPRYAVLGQPRWEDVRPIDWKPYQSRPRWFRMPNDSFLTQIRHCAQDLCLADKERFFGTAHPTAEGHARMADAYLSALESPPPVRSGDLAAR